ncbi:MAG: HD domain-containing protein, partial [Treponema sp.]|nr:HD domain-containing protein [Treponema sp.]
MLQNDLVAINQKILSFNNTDQDRILKAIELLREYSADHSFDEITGAVSILLDLGLDADSIITVLIRQLPFSSIEKSSIEQFGTTVSSLVQGLKKIDGLKTNTNTIYEAQNVRNMLFALTGDIRVILIKLAEKLYTLRVLDLSSDEEARKTAAQECLDLYAPLAGRLGISWIKNEMEDLSLKFLSRETYQQIKSLVAAKRGERNQFLELSR